MNIRDSVKSAVNKVSSESNQLSANVRDQAQPLAERLASFAKIIQLEVGDTGLTRAKAIERAFDLRQVLIKYEGDNPTGTQKDRIAFAQVHDALRCGMEVIALATCGNYGVAVALAAQLAGLRCMIYIPAGYHTERIAEMERLAAVIVRSPGTYEEVVTTSSRDAAQHQWYDANPGGANTHLQISAYAQIATEICRILSDAPQYCAVPVSNGTLLAGIYQGFVERHQRGETTRIPQMIAASSTRKNPIVNSFLKGLTTCQDLDPEKIKETKHNEPLINWHSFDGEEALQAIRQSQGDAFNISDKKLLDMSAFLNRQEGYRILPASTAGLIGLLQLHERTPLAADQFVAVLTARK